MAPYRWDELEWEARSLGNLWDSVDVLAVWMAAPWDPAYPWRWGVALEGRAHPLGPYQGGRVWAMWGTARSKGEARDKAEVQALVFLRALPREWVRLDGAGWLF